MKPAQKYRGGRPRGFGAPVPDLPEGTPVGAVLLALIEASRAGDLPSRTRVIEAVACALKAASGVRRAARDALKLTSPRWTYLAREAWLRDTLAEWPVTIGATVHRAVEK